MTALNTHEARQVKFAFDRTAEWNDPAQHPEYHNVRVTGTGAFPGKCKDVEGQAQSATYADLERQAVQLADDGREKLLTQVHTDQTAWTVSDSQNTNSHLVCSKCPPPQCLSDSDCVGGAQICCGGLCIATCGDCQQCDSETGQCGGGCAAGLTCCNGNCVDTTKDPQNCGNCGVVCGAGKTCCATPTPICVDTQNDSYNCGACGNICPDNPANPGAPQGCIAGGCIDFCTDTHHCGPFGVDCTAYGPNFKCCCGGGCYDAAFPCPPGVGYTGCKTIHPTCPY
jgi:hypothetical protein